MPEPQARLARDVYDHEHDEPQSGRREAADWGVGDELFEQMPRRRFERGGDGRIQERRPSARRGAHADRRTIVISRPEDLPSEIAAVVADKDLSDFEPEATNPAEGEPTRRTVTISGRPGEASAPRFAEGPQRLRPPRSMTDKMGATPDRLAAWAVALGLLLILIALLS